MLELTFDGVILTQELVHGGLHSATDAIAVALHQLYDALGGHEEDVAIGTFLQRSSMAIDDASNLLRWELGEYGCNVSFVECHQLANFLLHRQWNAARDGCNDLLQFQ